MTAMSYRDAAFVDSTDTNTPMPYDIAALQFLYGANITTNTGNTTYVIDHYTVDIKRYCRWMHIIEDIMLRLNYLAVV